MSEKLVLNIPAVVLQCHTDQYHIVAVYADLSAWIHTDLPSPKPSAESCREFGFPVKV